MKASAIALAILAPLALAVPAPRHGGNFNQAELTFHGATPQDVYTVSAPTDGSVFRIENQPTSVSTIDGAAGATCTIFGSEGSITTLFGSGTYAVGPPQPQVSGTCTRFD